MLVPVLLAALAGPAPAPTPAALLAPQEDAERQVLELRVISSQAGSAIVDRGTNDGLALGDRVRFLPRAGGSFEGTIQALNARSAVVRFDDPAATTAPGTRAEVRIPRDRLAAVPPPVPQPGAPPAAAPEAAPQAQAQAQEHPPWPERKDEWSAQDPLLARLRPVRPAERARTVHGRTYSIVDYIRSTEDDRTDGFYRLGGELEAENVTGHGDSLYSWAEINYRNTDVPDQDDEEGTTVRLNRLSYVRGGTRFERERWEFGRFLPTGVPEFGVLDGAEWIARGADGDQFGASLGFLPEPDADFSTGSDFELAGFYRWVFDESRQLSATAAYQKTFHHWDADRDLVLTNLSYLPLVGWTFFGTAWIDLYTEGDNQKPFAEPTQIYVTTGRRYASGSSFDLVYTHLAFPQIDRHEFEPVSDDQLADDHNDRLALDTLQALADDLDLRAGVGAWVDEDESGVDGEIGFDVRNVFERGFADVSVFATGGRFVKTLGGRMALGVDTEAGRFGLEYEYSGNRLDGFSSNNDDLPQHRVRASQEYYSVSGWSLSSHVEVVLWDTENSVSAGFFLEKSF